MSRLSIKWGGFFFSACLACVYSGLVAAEAHYFFSLSGKSKARAAYEAELLQLIFTETEARWGAAQIKFDTRDLSTWRVWKETNTGKTSQILTSSNWQTLEQTDYAITRIDFPTQKGLLGYRKCLVRKDSLPRLQKIKTPSEFARLSVGQGQGWQDNIYYRINHINVVTGARFSNLIPMLIAGRFDCLPLGILELEDFIAEAGAYAEDLTVLPDVIIFYKLAVYFGVTNTHPELIERMNAGFAKIITNGKFDQLFYKHYRAALNDLNAGNKTVFVLLGNPDANEMPTLVRNHNVHVLKPAYGL